MNKCPFNHGVAIRPELQTPPPNIAKLPLDKRGFPIPWFVDWIGDEPEFRAMDPQKLVKALKRNLCWCCGEPLGTTKVFVIGPMCAINRVSSEPPSHMECARWSAQNCPFLTQRQVKRREDEVTLACSMAGVGIMRNPGVTLLWTTYAFKPFRVDNGILFDIGHPEATEWWSHGRIATRAEVLESVRTGLPELEKAAARGGEEAINDLALSVKRAEALYPCEQTA